MMRRALSSPPAALRALSLIVLSAALVAPRTAHATPPTIQHFTATLSDLNLITLDWQVSGGDPSNLLYIYEDVGFRPQACRSAPQPPGCSTTKRITAPGVYRYTLSVRNAALEFANQTIEVTVPDLPPPTTATGNVDVDMLNVQPQSIWWSHAATPTGFVRLFNGGIFPVADNLPTTGTYPVPTSALTVGRHGYSIVYCERPASDPTPLCGGGVPFNFNVRPAHFAGDYRLFVPSGQSLTLSWSGSGNAWFLEAPTLGLSSWLNQPTYTVPASALTAGVHTFKVTSCSFTASSSTCSNRVDVYAPQAGVVTFTAPWNSPVTAGAQVGSLAPTGGGSAIPLTAARTGTFFNLVASGSSAAAGADLAAVITEDKDFKQVVVGADSVATWTTRAWTADFTGSTWDTGARQPDGAPLDVAFDSSGGLWQLGEYSTGIAHVSSGGVLTHHDEPLWRVWNPSSGLYEKVKPFGSTLFQPVGSSTNVNYTELGERVIDTGSAVWFTQGGGLFAPGTGNYSRLVRFDRNGSDSPATPDDDRLCAVHVPGNNSEVISVAYDGQHVWFTEGVARVLGWFDAASATCNNSLDYSNPQAVQAAETNIRCTTAPTQPGCIHEIALPAAVGFPAHITIDSDATLWISDFKGGALSHYDPSTSAWTTFPMPTSIATWQFRGAPWQIRVDADAVYIGEYSDNDLILFDKHASNCGALVNGQNPCMKQIHVPVKSSDVALHSIDLAAGKLWFTLANEASGPLDPNASTFGYVDVFSWKAGAPVGVLYNGIETLGDLSAGRYHSFRGIDVTAQRQVVLADLHTNEVVRLDPIP